MFYIATKDGLSVSFPGGKNFQVAKDHVNFKKVLDLVTKNSNCTVEEVEGLVNLKKALQSVKEEDVELKLNGADELEVFVDGKKYEILDKSLEWRLIQMIKDNDDELRAASIKSFAKFIKNLNQNPSFQSVRQLYGFLDKNDLPITQNGTFLAYKKVRHDFLDIHSGTFDNSIGKDVAMPRYQVEDNPEVTCSRGLHVCSYSYLEHYAQSDLDHVVICEVNPKDVVSVPYDYNNAKMRVCAYKVVDEVPTFFEAQLAGYVYGNHADGWLMETFTKLADFYKSFFKTTKVDFNSNPDTVSVTPAVIEAFFKAAKKSFADLPDSFVEDWKKYNETSLPTIKDMITILSKYDSNWVVKSEDKDEESAE